MNKVTKAIIPTAGYGTRWLPITKAVEKNMMPIGNRPVIDYVVDDLIRAGITDIIFVVGENSAQLRAYYGDNEPLENHLKSHGKTEKLEEAKALRKKARFTYVVQDRYQPYGTAVPLWLCRNLIKSGESFLFVSGDNIYRHQKGSSEAQHLLKSAEKAGVNAAMLAVKVPYEEVYKYGVVKLRHEGKLDLYEYIVEKPKVEDAPSDLNNATFWLFTTEIFKYAIDYVGQHQSGEYLVTDVANNFVAAGNKIAVFKTKGEYLDCGSVEGWLYANHRMLGFAENPVVTKKL